MTSLVSEVRQGMYYDSVVLMQLQTALRQLPGVVDSGVVMATAANLSMLHANGLLQAELEQGLGPEDLVIAVLADNEAAAREALGSLDELLARRRPRSGGEEYQPHSLSAAVKLRPAAGWVLVSVPGRNAFRVAREALDNRRHVFLYSDNVTLNEEVALKQMACARGLMVMGPDCGTAVVAGAGLGFANRVRRGGIGLVGASGTGLQAVMSQIHALGEGVSHALGTGGRDLHKEVGGTTALQALDLLARDPETRVIVLISKPPSSEVAARLLTAARRCGKPVVVSFLGYPSPARRLGRLGFACDLRDTAEMAVALAQEAASTDRAEVPSGKAGKVQVPDLRGLFSGGTLALQALMGLRPFLHPLGSNVAVSGVEALSDPNRVSGHAIVDLGDDALTVGRLHPMIDPEILWRRLALEAEDSRVGTLLLDVVLGDGAHEDPASGLAPVVQRILSRRNDLEVVIVVVGTEEDPQDLQAQVERLEGAGAKVFRDVGAAVDRIATRMISGQGTPGTESALPAVDDSALARPFAAINVGLESFRDSLVDQEIEVLQVQWRPPAGGNTRLLEILDQLRSPAP